MVNNDNERDCNDLSEWSQQRSETQRLACALSTFFVGDHEARPSDIAITRGTHGCSVTFRFPGCFRGIVQIRGPGDFFLSYVVADMWEYQDTASFESLDDLRDFLGRMIPRIRKYALAALEPCTD